MGYYMISHLDGKS